MSTIMHYGVKGMRWGIRRRGVNVGRVYFEKNDGTKKTNRAGFISEGKPKRKVPTSNDFRRAQEAKAKITKGKNPTKALENDELQKLVKRMNLEKQYAELSQRDKRKVVGAKFVGDVLQGIGKQQAQRLGNELATAQIEKLLKNAGIRKK